MLLLVGAGEAAAYVRYQTNVGAGFAWMPSCLPLPIVVYPDALAQMTIGEETSAVTGAGAAWSAGGEPVHLHRARGDRARAGPHRRPATTGATQSFFADTSWCALAASGACEPDGHRLRSGGARR